MRGLSQPGFVPATSTTLGPAKPSLKSNLAASFVKPSSRKSAKNEQEIVPLLAPFVA
jgi:hypothetical protein